MKKAKRLWVHLAGTGPYLLRPMEDECSGSEEMLRRIAAKEGYYRGQSRRGYETPPEHYTQDQVRYFDEGVSLGLSVPVNAKHPFGELSENGGVPMLPFLGDNGY